jgi:hypothetical protein
LTKNYTNFFQQNCRTPETLAEAIDQLQMVLDTEQKASLVAMREENLVNLHFSLGMVIRNAFRLHDPGSKLLASCNKALYRLRIVADSAQLRALVECPISALGVRYPAHPSARQHAAAGS